MSIRLNVQHLCHFSDAALSALSVLSTSSGDTVSLID